MILQQIFLKQLNILLFGEINMKLILDSILQQIISNKSSFSTEITLTQYYYKIHWKTN
jgi:hypothetical protein